MAMDKKDIQALLVSDHNDLNGGAFMMLEITDSLLARKWIKSIFSRINGGDNLDSPTRLQIAFRYSGMQKLGADEFVDHGFAAEFTQGMTVDFRRRTLGDLDENAPENWIWGGPNNEPIDLILMVYTVTEEAAKQEQAADEVDDTAEA